jgi:ubiquinone/menaquinone biosynthesis C-methylase UbiE
MQPLQNILECYNRTASNYADKFIDELNHKHLDRLLLKSFIEENINRGRIIDLGCGPGQTTKFLSDHDVSDIVGVDISEQMIAVARRLHPHLIFEVGDMLNLPYPEKSFGSAIAFYSIVHFDITEVDKAFKEICRVLKDEGEFLFSFHVGNNTIHMDEFLDHHVDIDFYFFETKPIIETAKNAGFNIVDVIERHPYEGVEYPSRRAYLWCKKL